jgi:hypothetical protein
LKYGTERPAAQRFGTLPDPCSEQLKRATDRSVHGQQSHAA